MRHRIPLYLILFLGAFALAGCVTGPRSEKDLDPLPPLDMQSDELEESLATIRTRSYQFPTPQEYVLGPGDILSIRLTGRPDIFGSKEEDPDAGKYTLTDTPFLYLPHIGAVRVHGKTPQQLQEDLRSAYAAVVKDPSPVITVEKYFQNHVIVLGSVKEPGRYDLEPGDSLLEAIFRAGGLTLGGRSGELPPARLLRVYRATIDRRARVNTDIDDLMYRLETEGSLMPREEIVIPLDDFLLGGNLSYNLPLLPNDIVYIPPAGTVTVFGKVINPRVVFLGPGLRTLGDVLNECGGMRYDSHSRIEVVRNDSDGDTESYYYHGRDVLTRRERDLYMQDNDRVYVYTSGWRKTLHTFSSIFTTTATTGINATYSPGM